MESYAAGRRFGPGCLKSRLVGRYGYQLVQTLHNCTQLMGKEGEGVDEYHYLFLPLD